MIPFRFLDKRNMYADLPKKAVLGPFEWMKPVPAVCSIPLIAVEQSPMKESCT